VRISKAIFKIGTILEKTVFTLTAILEARRFLTNCVTAEAVSNCQPVCIRAYRGLQAPIGPRGGPTPIPKAPKPLFFEVFQGSMAREALEKVWVGCWRGCGGVVQAP